MPPAGESRLPASHGLLIACKSCVGRRHPSSSGHARGASTAEHGHADTIPLPRTSPPTGECAVQPPSPAPPSALLPGMHNSRTPTPLPATAPARVSSLLPCAPSPFLTRGRHCLRSSVVRHQGLSVYLRGTLLQVRSLPLSNAG